MKNLVQRRGNGKDYGRKDEKLDDQKLQLRCRRFRYEDEKNLRERRLNKEKLKENWGLGEENRKNKRNLSEFD